MTPTTTKPRLLAIELWEVGDLVIATQFLRAAARKYDVTLIAKPFAKDMQPMLWPEIQVLPFTAPWTVFRHKYRLYSWPWRELFRLRWKVRAGGFDLGVGARWDPRNHFLMAFIGVKKRVGFPRLGSQIFLTNPLPRPGPTAHRYEYWRTLGQAIGVELPARESIPVLRRSEDGSRRILIHTGAGKPIRVWPLENYRKLALRLREKQYSVQVACNSEQRDWWLRNGESEVATPRTLPELLALLQHARLLIGNDSGPGHLAACVGVPTFTIFGPQLPEWFAPLHPDSEWIEGKACTYKPCWDYCHFAEPICLTHVTVPEVWARVEPFARKILDSKRTVASAN